MFSEAGSPLYSSGSSGSQFTLSYYSRLHDNGLVISFQARCCDRQTEQSGATALKRV